MSDISLRYRTNAADFDFDPFGGWPASTYVIASTPRCGSNLLQRALWRTARAGAPEEYFAEGYLSDYAERWPDILRNEGEGLGRIDLLEYRARLFQHRTTPNGVFGIKLHGSHLRDLEKQKARPEDLFPGARFVWMRRHDRVAQAVSYAMADQTGVWILDGEWLPDKQPVGQPAYDFDVILQCLRIILDEESLWSQYLASQPFEAMIVWYEDLVARYEDVVRTCLRFVGVINDLNEVPEPRIRRQATRLNAEWTQRFESDLHARGTAQELDQLLDF